jgi:hypothetical protein
MHAAHRPFLAIIGDIGLSDDGLQAMRLELMLTKDPSEEPPRILAALHFNYERTP